MTFAEIISREEANMNRIFLYKEGIFLKAYERSAFFVHMYIHEFKLSKRYIKTVNQDVISLGFPEQTVAKWLHGHRYVYISENLVECEIGRTYDEVKFHHWKESVLVNAADRYTPHTHVIEKAPVYKNAYDLLVQIISFSVHVSRNVQNPIGNNLKGLAYRLCYLVRNLYDVADREKQIDDALELCSEIEYILQILRDLKEISVKAFALASERVISVSRQLVALRVKVKA